MSWKEELPAWFRPAVRRYKDMTNEELQGLFELRASKVKLDPKGFWDDNRIVYWSTMIPVLASLYEIMLEIQSRYPASEMLYEGEARFWEPLLPVPEAGWLRLALANLKDPVCGLQELNESTPDGNSQSSGGGTEHRVKARSKRGHV